MALTVFFHGIAAEVRCVATRKTWHGGKSGLSRSRNTTALHRLISASASPAPKAAEGAASWQRPWRPTTRQRQRQPERGSCQAPDVAESNVQRERQPVVGILLTGCDAK